MQEELFHTHLLAGLPEGIPVQGPRDVPDEVGPEGGLLHHHLRGLDGERVALVCALDVATEYVVS